MRFLCGLTIVLLLAFPLTGMGSQQPTAASPTNAPEQTPDLTTAPTEKVPAEPTPAVEDKPQQNGDKGTNATAPPPTIPSKAGKKRRSHAPTPVPANGPRKIVVREGGASEPAAQIVPGMTPAEALRQRQNADQWLVGADQKLRLLAGRTLDAQQLETVGQIHNYMDGARLALKAGDVRRANTLAEKADLLADDLAKH